MMQLNEYQHLATRTANRLTGREQLNCAALGLAGESGEFADIVKKLMFHGHEFTDEMWEKLADEVGDILWYVSLAAHALNMLHPKNGCTTLDELAERNIEKLKKRYPEGFDSQVSERRYHEPNKVAKILCPECGEYHSMFNSAVCQEEKVSPQPSPPKGFDVL